MTVLSDKKVKIRKPHQCYCCLRKFEKGVTMNAQSCVYDGSCYTVYSCLTCDTLIHKYSDHFLDHGENVYPEGCVREHYSDAKVTNPEEMLIYLDNVNNRVEV